VAYLPVSYGDAASPVAFLSGWSIACTQGDAIDITGHVDPQHVYATGEPSWAGSFTGWFDTATAQAYTAAADGLPRNMYLYPSIRNAGQFFSGLIFPGYAVGGGTASAVQLTVQWSAAGPVIKTG